MTLSSAAFAFAFVFPMVWSKSPNVSNLGNALVVEESFPNNCLFLGFVALFGLMTFVWLCQAQLGPVPFLPSISFFYLYLWVEPKLEITYGSIRFDFYKKCLEELNRTGPMWLQFDSAQFSVWKEKNIEMCE